MCTGWGEAWETFYPYRYLRSVATNVAYLTFGFLLFGNRTLGFNMFVSQPLGPHSGSTDGVNWCD